MYFEREVQMRILTFLFILFSMMGSTQLSAAVKTNTFLYLYTMAQTANLSLVQIASQKWALEKNANPTNSLQFRQVFLLLEQNGKEIIRTTAAKMDTFVKKHPTPVRFIQRSWVSNYRILSMQTDSVGADQTGRFFLNVRTAYAVEKEFHGNIHYRYKDNRRKVVGYDLGYPNARGQTACFLSLEITEDLSHMAFIEFFQ